MTFEICEACFRLCGRWRPGLRWAVRRLSFAEPRIHVDGSFLPNQQELALRPSLRSVQSAQDDYLFLANLVWAVLRDGVADQFEIIRGISRMTARPVLRA